MLKFDVVTKSLVNDEYGARVLRAADIDVAARLAVEQCPETRFVVAVVQDDYWNEFVREAFKNLTAPVPSRAGTSQ